MKTTFPQVALVTGASSGIGKAATRTLAAAGFTVIGTIRDTSRIAPGNMPPAVYARRRGVFEEVMRESMRGGDDPAVVAKVIAAAATDPKPKLRYTAGSTAGRVSVLGRIAAARAFDKSVRKLNRMVG